MKKIIVVILSFISCWISTSCDDGDILLTEFEFDEQTLQLCNGAQDNDFVFFKINTDLQEAISFNFNNDIFSDTIPTTTPIEILLENTTTAAVIYRKFNTEISADYYCNTIPPSSITVTEELTSISGIVTITTTIATEDDNDGVDAIDESGGIDPTADPDGDGVPNYLDDDRNDATIGDDNNGIEDGFDTDNDGIPNYKDQDDDDDTILTSAELDNDDPDNDELRDTDGDGIPDYLDRDDDNDGINTDDEDIDGDGNPRDDDEDGNSIPNYLQQDAMNPSDTTAPPIDNTVQTTFVTRVNATNLQFDGNTENFNDDSFSFGAREVSIPKTTSKGTN